MGINSIAISGTLIDYPHTSWTPSGERCTCRMQADVGGGIFTLVFDGSLALAALRRKKGASLTVEGRLDIKTKKGRSCAWTDHLIRVREVTEEV